MEEQVSEVEDTSHTHDTHLSELHEKTDDAEDRQRWNNVQVVGLLEGAEGAKPVLFAEQFFKQLLSLQDLSPTYVLERAHRVPTGVHPPGAFPRPFLVRFLNYKDRDMILAQPENRPRRRAHVNNCDRRVQRIRHITDHSK